METNSLKALALKVLHGNTAGNIKETSAFLPGNIKETSLETGKTGRKAYRVYSEILACHLWVAYSADDIAALRAQGITEAIYTADEIPKIRRLPKKSLEMIQRVKEVFPMSIIEEGNTCKRYGSRQSISKSDDKRRKKIE